MVLTRIESIILSLFTVKLIDYRFRFLQSILSTYLQIPIARRRLCAGFRQCGPVVGVCAVNLRLVDGGCLVLVRVGGACRVVSGGLRVGVALVDVRLDVVPLPPRSSSPTVVVGWVGILLDVIGGVESALWGCYPALTLAPTCGSNRAS